jgi:hypothetical protein
LSPLIVALSDREDARAAHLSIYLSIYLFISLSIFVKRNNKKKFAAAALCFGEKQKKKGCQTSLGFKSFF